MTDDEKRLQQTNLGEVLRLSGVVSQADIEHAVEVKRAEDVPIGVALVKVGAATLDDVEDAAELQKRLRADDPQVKAEAFAELFQRSSRYADEGAQRLDEMGDGEPTRPEPVAPSKPR